MEEMARSAELRGPCTVVVDGTGVGCAGVDLLRESDMDCELVAVQITGGARRGRRAECGMFRSGI